MFMLALLFVAALGHAEWSSWPDYRSPGAGDRWAALTADDLGTIIASGVGVDRTDPSGWTPLMHVLRYNTAVEVVEALIAAGADVDARETIAPERTALMVALRYNENDAVVAALLHAGANVHGRDAHRETALMVAARRTDPGALEMLIRAGAEVDGRDELGMTALMLAAHWNRNVEMVRTLLSAGADVHARDEFGSTALAVAVWNTNPEVVETLLEAGAHRDINSLSRYGTTVLTEAIEYGADRAIIAALIEGGADVNLRGPFGETALMVASQVAQSPLVLEMLLSSGADPTLRDGTGSTALDYARSNEALIGAEVLEQLRE